MAAFRALVARLRWRKPRLARIDSLGTILDAASETGAVIMVPGVTSWLYGTEQERADYRASIDGKFTESFEDYCARISRTEAVS